MAYQNPPQIATSMVNAGAMKIDLPVKDLLLRGALSGAFLGFATSLAVTAAVQTGMPIVGAIIFPVGFCMIVLLGLELVTGSFAVVPLAVIAKKPGATTGAVIVNWTWVYIGNLIGSVIYAFFLAIALTMMFTLDPNPIGQKLIAIAEAKTLGYEGAGFEAGMVTSFIKGILCNWMVTLGVVMAMASASVIGKIAAMWLPILIFFGQGFEHAVVNMFVIPVGMMMGAEVTMGQWWIWNQIPVTIGNIVGGMFFTGLAIYITHAPKDDST